MKAALPAVADLFADVFGERRGCGRRDPAAVSDTFLLRFPSDTVTFVHADCRVTMSYGAQTSRTETLSWWLQECASARREAKRRGAGLLHVNQTGGIQAQGAHLQDLREWLEALTDPRTRTGAVGAFP